MKNCLHCNLITENILDQSNNFYVVCDSYPLKEGHILIIPKRHVRCIAQYSSSEFKEFLGIYYQIRKWIEKTYQSKVATFEHGRIGQTVFHSHVHLLPFRGDHHHIIEEGKNKLAPLHSLENLIAIFAIDKKYLFLSIGQSMWTVDLSLAAPRFFRERFAKALGCESRADWKKNYTNPVLLKVAQQENKRCQERFFSR